MTDHKATASALLTKVGLKKTPARLSIVEIFLRIPSPLDAETIYDEIKKMRRNGSLNLATIYRTISILEKKQVIKKIDMRQNASFFELASGHHHHIICTSCGIFEDIMECHFADNMKKLTSEIVRKSAKFSDISDHSLEFFSKCKKCVLN